MFTHEFHNCGDQLIHLHLVRALTKLYPDTFFTHFCNGCHHENLREVISDLPNILLVPFESPLWQERQHESIGVWKNEGGAWVESPFRWDWSAYHLWWHKVVARRMGFESPFTVREHLLFDYPALEEEYAGSTFAADFLIGDSAPSSGQYSEWADHSKEPLNRLVDILRASGKTILRTSDLKSLGCTISEIGRASVFYRHNIMVPNGPFWATMNTTNHHFSKGRKRIILMDNGEQLNMPNIIQCANVDEVMTIAKEEKWI